MPTLKKNTQIKKITRKISDKWHTLTPKEKFLIIISTLLLPSFIFMKLYALPQKNKIDQLNKQKIKLEKKLQLLKKKKENLNKIREDTAKIEEILKEAEQYLPQKQEIAKLLEEISKEQDRFNISIESLKIEKEKVLKASFFEIPLKIVIKGNFANIMLFLDNIRKKERILNPSEISIKKTKGEKVVAICVIKTYKLGKQKAND